MLCSKCGKEVADDLQFCVHCGARLQKKDTKEGYLPPAEQRAPHRREDDTAQRTEKESVPSMALRIFLLVLLILALAAGTAFFSWLLYLIGFLPLSI